MLLNQVLTEAGNSALMAERVGHYHEQAARHLDEVHPDRTETLSAEIKKALITSAYERADARGIKRTRDHLNYLSLAAQLGVAFEQNPLHRRALVRAGWCGQDGSAHRISSFDVVLSWTGQWQGLTALDAEDFDLSYLSDTALEMCAGYDAHTLLRAVMDIYPNRTGAVPKIALQEAVLSAHHYTSTRSMAPDAAFLFVLACIHLGLRFPVEPRYHGVSEMFEPEAPALTAQALATALEEVAPW